MNEWYPHNREELNSLLDELLKSKTKINSPVHGLVVPHAGYSFSGKIAGNAFSLLKNIKTKRAIVLSPSHYSAFRGVSSLQKIKTPLGEMKITGNRFPELAYEHAIDNEIPFLQKLGFNEVLPLVIGEINEKQAREIAEQIAKQEEDVIYIVSTDLSHFLSYNYAVKADRKTIRIIENTEIPNWKEADACGIYPLLVLMNLCRIKNWKPKLIEYKNSGDITGDKRSVVGYSSFYF
jgi:MEMO1 family protein